MAELRRYSRVPLHEPMPLAFSKIEAPGMWSNDGAANGTAADLSVKGCQVRSDASIQKGDHVALRFHIPDGKKPVSIEMATVRWTEGDRFGLEFISLWPSDEVVLKEVIHTASRYDRAM